MSDFLLITDDVDASGKIVFGLRNLGDWIVQAYDAPRLRIGAAGVTILDVATQRLSHPAVVAAVRELQARKIPILHLVHDLGPDCWILVRAIAADVVLPHSARADELYAAVRRLRAPSRPLVRADRHAHEVKNYFNLLFRKTADISPEFVHVGSGMVQDAVFDVGVREWILAVQDFDDVTHQHCLTVTGLAAAFSAALAFSPSECERLTKGALLHDIGKTAIPHQILNKPGALDPQETTIMRTHAAIGRQMIADRGFDGEVLQIVGDHHEMLDGSGYPHGLAASAIPDIVRLVTICDVYSALIEARPYKQPMSADAAFEIMRNMGPKLDQALVRAFRPVALALDDGVRGVA